MICFKWIKLHLRLTKSETRNLRKIIFPPLFYPDNFYTLTDNMAVASISTSNSGLISLLTSIIVVAGLMA